MKVYVLDMDTARQYLMLKDGRELEDEFVEKVLTLKEKECREIATASEKHNESCGIYNGRSFEREFNHDLDASLSPDKVFIRIFA